MEADVIVTVFSVHYSRQNMLSAMILHKSEPSFEVYATVDTCSDFYYFIRYVNDIVVVLVCVGDV